MNIFHSCYLVILMALLVLVQSCSPPKKDDAIKKSDIDATVHHHPSVTYDHDYIFSIKINGVGLGFSFEESIKSLKSKGIPYKVINDFEDKDLGYTRIVVGGDEDIDKWYGSKRYSTRYVFSRSKKYVVAIESRFYPSKKIFVKPSISFATENNGGIFTNRYYFGSETLRAYKDAEFFLNCSKFYLVNSFGGSSGPPGRGSGCSSSDDVLKMPYLYIVKSRSSNKGFEDNDFVSIVDGSYYYSMRNSL